MALRLRPGPDAASVRVVNESPEQPLEASSPSRSASPDQRAAADLDRIGRDLAGVEAALQRLDAGTYWTDEVSGEPIPDEVLIADPVARRVR